VLSKPVLREPVMIQPVLGQPLGAPVWGGDAEPPGDFAAAQPDLLRRVLDGLRRLS